MEYATCASCKTRKELSEYAVVKGLVRKSCNSCLESSRKQRIANKCEHGKRKDQCKSCGGSSFCEHGKQKAYCKECGGSAFCEHGKQKAKCKECGGSSFCIHDRRKAQCKVYHPSQYMASLVSHQVARCFKHSKLPKINHSISYLGCDTDHLIVHLKSKLKENETMDDIHIDHIKPLSKFDLDIEEEFLKCCHYTNLQPLSATDNFKKHNTWSETDEAFWNENIIYNTYSGIYIPS